MYIITYIYIYTLKWTLEEKHWKKKRGVSVAPESFMVVGVSVTHHCPDCCGGDDKKMRIAMDSQRWLICGWIPKGGWFVVGFPKVVELWTNWKFPSFCQQPNDIRIVKTVHSKPPKKTPTAPAGPRGWGSCQFQHRSRSDDVGWLGNILTKQSICRDHFPKKWGNIIPKYEMPVPAKILPQ